MSSKYLKTYEFGDPTIYGKYDKIVYEVSVLKVGWELRQYWVDNVKRYFNRSKPNFFTPGGKFRMPKKIKPPGKSFMTQALSEPMIASTGLGWLGLRNVVKTDESGKQIELIKLLMKGAPPHQGAYNPSLGVRVSTGKWKGFSASYWRRWDGVFTKTCIDYRPRVRKYCEQLGSGGGIMHDGVWYKDIDELLLNYKTRVIPRL